MSRINRGFTNLLFRPFSRFFPAVLFSFGFCLLFSGMTFAEEKPIGKVIGVSGTVEFLSGTQIPVAEAKPGEVRPVAFQKWEKIKHHQPVYPKDQFRTLRKSRVKILFNDNSLIALGPNSEIKVESYIYSLKDKLRQGITNLGHGLSMYLINKSQKNIDSFFRIVTPTANIAARGTQGFVSSSKDVTRVANYVGEVKAKNVEFGLCDRIVQDDEEREEEPCQETRVVGALEAVTISKGKPPTKPIKLTKNQFNEIRNIILGTITTASAGGDGPDGKPLISITEGGDSGDGPSKGFEGEFFSAIDPIDPLFDDINEPFDVSQLDTCTP